MKPIPFILILLFISISNVNATDFHIGPDQDYLSISTVPWETLTAGDHVYIHWRSDSEGGAYKEKWVINIAGTEAEPFIVSGIPGPNGERPVIDGNGAVTREELSFWNGVRGVLKIGGSTIPSNDTPSYIIIENLEIRSAHPDYSFTNEKGVKENYRKNASSIYIESGHHIIIRNCVIHDSANGLFSAHESSDLSIEHNFIHSNGIIGSIYQHNAYTETTNIIFQYNQFGPLRDGASGNNLKDRSAGLVVRYNWLEGGNRLLDLVESDFAAYYDNPDYRKTYVYGNILIEKDGGNPQVIHYGGDNGNENYYRKGKLYFYNNTLYSIRSEKTTLLRLSSNDESADIRNNILYVIASGNQLSILDDTGHAFLRSNWIKTGWTSSNSGTISGSFDADNSNLEGDAPGFVNGAESDFHLRSNSICIDKGTDLLAAVLPEHNVIMEFVQAQHKKERSLIGKLDLGCFEYVDNSLGINNFESTTKKLSVYPVPVKNPLYIGKNFFEIEAGRIFSTNGRTVLSFVTHEHKIDVSSLQNGLYILELNTGAGKMTTKIIKN